MPADRKTLPLKIVIYTDGQKDNGARLFPLLQELLQRGYAVDVSSQHEYDWDHSREALCIMYNSGGSELSVDATYAHLIDMHEKSTDDILAEVESRSQPVEKHWKPWFPVIDFDRCTNCMQCLTFCLFNVYSVGEGEQITVQNPDNCKTDCPACSRVCPEVAIMFPKYKAGPINGAAVSEADMQREKVKVNITALLGGDIYDALKNRRAASKKRFSQERDEDRALKERKKCLKKLKKALDIPDEVIASLPSMDMINDRRDEVMKSAEIMNDGAVDDNKDEEGA